MVKWGKIVYSGIIMVVRSENNTISAGGSVVSKIYKAYGNLNTRKVAQIGLNFCTIISILKYVSRYLMKDWNKVNNKI